MVINQIIAQVWPQAMGLTPMPLMFQKLHHFLSTLPTHDPLDPSTHFEHINDDLVGFFNALPQHQILTDFDLLIQAYLDLTHKPPNTTSFTVDLSQSSTQLHKVHNGSVTYNHKATHNLLHTKTIHLRHLRLIISTSFSTGIVRVMDMCLQQIQGSTIGNQISPTLCSIPVITRELQWQRSYNLWYTNHSSTFFLERYVDNRFGIIPSNLTKSSPMLEFNQEWFYQKPVQLEKVPDTHFLGTNIDINLRTVTPLPITELWQLRPARSAGTIQSLLNSFQSRLHIVIQTTYPQTALAHHIQTLKTAYIKAGYTHSQLQPIINKVLTKKHLAHHIPKFNPHTQPHSSPKPPP